jgi:hypothetical protein
MNLREKRNENARLIAEGKFIAQTLKNEGIDINQAIDSAMSNFESSFWKDKTFSIQGNNTLEYRHKLQHRFVDMKTRQTKDGSIRKKRHIIHNKIIYGHLNNIASELSFGFTDSVIENLKKIET